MAENKDKGAPATEAAEGSKGGKSAIVVMLVGLLVGAASGVLFVGPMVAGQPPAESDEADGHGGSGEEVHTHLVSGLIVNPAGTGGTRILLISVAIVVDSEEAISEIEDRDPEVRDLLLGVLARKTVEELTDIGLRETLKEELIAALQSMPIDGHVRQIHIPQFVVQ